MRLMCAVSFRPSGTKRFSSSSTTLAPGASFVLVNDHDPKPLYYQLEAEHPKQFSWTYLEQGPAVWRVEIGKLLKAA